MFAFSSEILLSNDASRGYAETLLYVGERTEGKTLNLDRKDLEWLPPIELFTKHELQRLDLSHNYFTHLPSEVGLLTHLRELKLCSNMRTPFSLSPELGDLRNLVNLKLSGNSLTSIPEELGEVKDLKMIDVSHNCLTNLPKSFEQLTQLAELRIDNNRLTELPPMSSTLNYLSLSFNTHLTSVSNCVEQIGLLQNLSHLEMRSCEVSQWPMTFSSLVKLQHLDLGCNRIMKLPDRCLQHFPLLQRLYLDHNQLKEIPNNIGELTNLKTLIFSGNELQEIPLSFRHLINLEDFSVDEENMLIPPREVVRNGLQAIRRFIESLAAESLPCYRIRLIVLGAPLSGKTSVLRRLRKGKALKKNQTKEQIQSEMEPTIYIDRKTFSVTTKQEDGTNATVELNTWDFCESGYEAYHQFFIAPNSIYIITIDLRDVSKENIQYWLRSISSRAEQDAPVFLVGTHADDKLFKEEGVISSALNSIAQEFGSRFPGIKLITAVSSYDGSGIEDLRNSLVSTALSQQHVGRIVPKPYTLLEEAIQVHEQEKKAAQHPPLLSWDSYKSMAAKCHIHTDSNLRSASAFLKDLGIINTFSDVTQSSHLHPIVVTDPQWICQLTANLMKSDCTKAIFPHSEIEYLWKAPLFPPELHKQCLEIMRNQRITYEGRSSTEDIIPRLLPARKPDLQLIWLRSDISRIQYERVWQFSYIPSGFFNFLLARLIVVTDEQVLWRKGCVFSLYGDWARLEEYSRSNCICLAVRSFQQSAPLVNYITSMITQLLCNYFPKAECQLRISCTHCVQQRVSDLWSFPVEECENALLSSQTHMTCQQKPNKPIPVDLKLIVPDLAFNQFENIKMELKSVELEKEKLAEGAYGVLYRGIFNNEQVAVKLLKTEGVSPEEQIEIFREFRNEVSIMAGTQHNNIVAIRGFCYGGGEIGMVMELVNSGDLHHLISDKSKVLNAPTSCKLAFDIAEGLHFLHNSTPPILHRDLKPGNILLSHSNEKWRYTAKLADFGLSTHQYFQHLKQRAVETPIWLPPEILSGGPYSTSSDVFAFGIIFYEMMERKLPYEDFDFRFMNQLEEDIIAGKRCDLSHIKETHPTIAQLIEACWHNDPAARPNFLSVMEEIVEIVANIDPELHKVLLARFQHISKLQKPKSILQSERSLVMGQFIKAVQTEPPEAASCMAVVGSDIWVAHKNGDISIWNSFNGELFRKIVAAHPREIKTILLVGTYVWTGSLDGMVCIWKSRAFPDKSQAKPLKEGYLEPADGTTTKFIKLHTKSRELLEGIPLQGSRTLPMAEQNKSGFTIQLVDGKEVKFYCANNTDRDGWVKCINMASRNCSEDTQDLKVAQIPHSRRLQIHSLVVHDNTVFVGASDLSIRAYNADTFESVDVHTLGLYGDCSLQRNEPAVRERSQGTFFSAERKPRKIANSINFGKHRGRVSSNILPNGNPLSDTEPTEEKFQSVSLLYGYGGYVWAVIHSLLLRCPVNDLGASSQGEGHEKRILSLCGVGDYLWSASEDRTIRVWNIHTLEVVRVLDSEYVVFVLLKIGASMYCGSEQHIDVWDTKEYKKTKTLSKHHTRPITSLVVVWDRIIWSASADATICIWS